MADLRDFRGKITPLTWAFLEIEAKATGAEFSEIAREILQGWAMRKLDAHTIATKVLADEGIAGNLREIPKTGQSR